MRTVVWCRNNCFGALLMGGMLLITACTPLSVKRLLEKPPPGIPQTALITTTPFLPQLDNYCGPSALAMTLNYYGVNTTSAELAKEVFIPQLGGSLQVEITAATRNHGFLSYVLPNKLDALLEEIAAGHPVIVLQNQGLKILPRWHYAVAVGYDLKQRLIVLHSGQNRFYKLPMRTFAYTWARSGNWAITPLPPGELPAQNDPDGVFLATVDAANSGLASPQIERAYRAGVQRWDYHQAFGLGLSNFYFDQQEYVKARNTIRQSLDHSVDKAPFYNNLAYVLLAEHCYQAARSAIACAVLHSSDSAYTDSLVEIKSIEHLMDKSASCPNIDCLQ